MHKNEWTCQIILFFLNSGREPTREMSARKRNRNGDFIGEEADHHSVSAHDPNTSLHQIKLELKFNQPLWHIFFLFSYRTGALAFCVYWSYLCMVQYVSMHVNIHQNMNLSLILLI